MTNLRPSQILYRRRVDEGLCVNCGMDVPFTMKRVSGKYEPVRLTRCPACMEQASNEQKKRYRVSAYAFRIWENSFIDGDGI
jgi:hypothetical protein